MMDFMANSRASFHTQLRRVLSYEMFAVLQAHGGYLSTVHLSDYGGILGRDLGELRIYRLVIKSVLRTNAHRAYFHCGSNCKDGKKSALHM